MAGFYGNISASNRTAFTFDLIYNSRVAMDEAITGANNDGVFLGRYVLVEYDNPPIIGYYNVGDQEFYSTNTFIAEAKLEKRAWAVYQDLGNLNSANSFWVCRPGNNTNLLTYVPYEGSTSSYATNYNLDVQSYGRGYDSTAWIKTFDPQTNGYRYVMVAELNTVVPNFHLVIDPPNSKPYGPYFDKSTTNLDYYMHVQAPFTFRINEVSDPTRSDEKITYKTSNYSTDDNAWHESTITDRDGDIFYNAAGFKKERSTHVLDMANTINYDLISSGQRFYGIENAAKDNSGLTAEDMYVWKIHLPVVGNTIAEVWDTLFTPNRLLEILYESQANAARCTVDTDSVLGVTNSMRCYTGKVYPMPQSLTINDDGSYTIAASDTLGATGTGGTLTFNKAILYRDDQHDTRRYFFPNYTNFWEENVNGDYYKANDGSYRLANKNAMPADTVYYARNQGTSADNPHWRYTYEYSSSALAMAAGATAVEADLTTEEDRADYYRTINADVDPQYAVIDDLVRINCAPHTIYGALAMVNRILGTGLSAADSRDDRTIVGMMNRMKDMVANIDTQPIPDRIVKTNANGQITVTTVPWIEPAIEASNSSVAPTVQTKYVNGVLSTSGDWVARFRVFNISGSSASVAELTTNNQNLTAKALADVIDDTMTFSTGNKWIRLAGDDTDNNKTITIAHALSGIAAATLSPSADGWGVADNDSDNTFTLPTFGFDEAGHIVQHSTISFAIPHSFKTFTIAAQSAAVTNSIGNTIDVIADSLADTVQFGTANKWLTIAGGDDSLTFGHVTSGVTAGSYGLAADETITTLDEDNIFEVPYFTVDEAGHITAASTQTVALPENFKTINVAINSNAVTALTLANTITSIEADGLEDVVTFASGNKWLQIASNSDTDTITFAHEIHSVTQTTPAVDFNTLTANQATASTFTADEITWDEAGHIVTRAKTTYTLPCAWKNISVVNTLDGTGTIIASNATISAATQVDTVTVTSNNKWILLTASGKGITAAHALSGLGAITNKGTGSAPTSQFGMTFNVPYLSIDAAGHISALTDTTITIPTPSLTDTATGNVIIGLSLTATSGALSTSRANIGTLALTEYTSPSGVTADTIVATDSLNAAIGKLVSRIAAEETARGLSDTAISGLDERLDDAEEAIVDLQDALDAENTGVLARLTAVETELGNNELGLIARVNAIENDYIDEDGLDTALDTLNTTIDENITNAVTNAINALLANYNLSLIAPTVNAIYNGNGIIEFTIDHADGTLNMYIEQLIEDTWTTVNLPAPDEEPYIYTVTENGTYRIQVQRTYNGSMASGTSADIIIDDLIETP